MELISTCALSSGTKFGELEVLLHYQQALEQIVGLGVQNNSWQHQQLINEAGGAGEQEYQQTPMILIQTDLSKSSYST